QIRDADGDGDPAERFGGHDCDDTDPLVNSNATEDWDNEVDDDCDGNAFDQDGDGYDRDVDCDDTDPDANVDRTWYEDADGDGIAGSTPTLACAPGPGSSAEPVPDCDDQDITVTLITLYRDADGDGFGDPDETSTAYCEPLDGWVPVAGDCDDTDPEQRPGAQWHDDADGDGFGAAAVAAVACERPTGRVIDATDCDDGDPDVFPGAPGEQLADGVDTDCDDASELPALACTPTPVDVYPDDIQAVLTAGGDCQALVLHVDASRATYGPVVLPDGAQVALIGAPFEDVVFLSPVGGSALVGDPAVLQLEKVTFSGWDTAISGGGGSVTMSEVIVDGGEVVRAARSAPILEIHDSTFAGVDLVYDPDWAGPASFDEVLVERALIASAVAPHVVLTGGRSSTTWRDLVVVNSAATVSIFSLPLGPTGRTMSIEGVRVQDSLGRALEGTLRNGDALVLTDLSFVGNIVVDRGLVVFMVTPQESASIEISGFVGRENTMEVFSALQTDLLKLAMFDFGPAVSTIEDLWLVGNVTGDSWLLQGLGTGSGLLFAGTGERGIRFNGAFDHVTMVGFGDGVDSLEPLGVGLDLIDAIVADLGTPLPDLRVHLERVMVGADAAGSCGVGDTCVEGVDPMFLRYDRDAPAEFWDFRVLPGSPAITAAGCPFLAGCDLGASTPSNAQVQYADSDGDDLYDTWETQFFGGPGQCDAADNADGDGYTNGEEFLSGTLPTMDDFDLDGLPDGPPDGNGRTWDDAPWDPSRG
ncbi:MAG: putative metal-binding motif-containing protein, partial [Myxococcales bacterium]|nr:putative metal-binding motif-containing protein [Myxococcales bacterium]